MTHPDRAIEAGARAADDIAAEIVNGLSFSTNRMVNGRLVGEQHFAAQAIANAIRAERARLRPEGYVLMPIEPTSSIIKAYIAADPRRKRYAATAKRDYRAMLAAAQEQDDARPSPEADR